MKTSASDKAADLDFWSSEVEPIPLGGGITNTNFIVDDQGERFVVRIGDDIPIHGVMRFNEIAAARAAHAAGISPEIVYNAEGVFVMRFIKGRTFTENDIREQRNLERILSLIQTCHNEIPKHFQGPALVFWPFHVCRSYILTAREVNSRMIDSLPLFVDINEELEKTFVAEALAAELSGLKGHRSVGGIRASIYNAMPQEGVERLVDFMKEFRRRHG